MDFDAKARLPDEHLDPIGAIPYAVMHIGAVLGFYYFPLSWEAVAVIVVSYFIRMFGITAGYHRYFSHRAFKTGRFFQFVLAFLGGASAQKGVLWWSGLHRHHHRNSDLPEDIHSPRRGLWWSHQGWMLCDKYLETPASQIREFKKFPELLFMDRFWLAAPLAWAGLLAMFGGAAWAFWGTVASTVLLWHGTFTINSLSHVWGTRRYDTTDTSRNNLLLALITLGEGWHNNHHFYQSSARQGFFWWEIDISFYVLKVLSWFGIVWDLRGVPEWALEGKPRKHAESAAPQTTTYELPKGLLTRMESLEQLRGQLARVKERAEQLDLRAQLAQSAADLAKRAAMAAQQAAAAAQSTSAVDLTARFRASAAEAATRAAGLAEEAAEAAREMAEAMRDRMTSAWAEAARHAAEMAAAAAREARHAA